MKLFEGHTFLAKPDTSRSDFLDEIKKFGFFSDVEFKYLDPAKEIVFVREVRVLERVGKMFRSILSKDVYKASGTALLHLSKKHDFGRCSWSVGV